MNVRTKKQRAVRRERGRTGRTYPVYKVYGRSIPVWRRLLHHSQGRSSAPLRKGATHYHRQYRSYHRNSVQNLQMEKA